MGNIGGRYYSRYIYLGRGALGAARVGAARPHARAPHAAPQTPASVARGTGRRAPPAPGARAWAARRRLHSGPARGGGGGSKLGLHASALSNSAAIPHLLEEEVARERPVIQVVDGEDASGCEARAHVARPLGAEAIWWSSTRREPRRGGTSGARQPEVETSAHGEPRRESWGGEREASARARRACASQHMGSGRVEGSMAKSHIGRRSPNRASSPAGSPRSRPRPPPRSDPANARRLLGQPGLLHGGCAPPRHRRAPRRRAAAMPRRGSRATARAPRARARRLGA